MVKTLLKKLQYIYIYIQGRVPETRVFAAMILARNPFFSPYEKRSLFIFASFFLFLFLRSMATTAMSRGEDGESI